MLEYDHTAKGQYNMNSVQDITGSCRSVYKTALGEMFLGDSREVLQAKSFAPLKGKVQLIFTSPPFPLNRKKRYGNLQGDQYIEWLSSFGTVFKELLTSTGSIVIELGNSWEPGQPTMSTLATKALISFSETNELHLIQEFIWHNPAKLPTPVQWVNVERIRLKDNFTKLWWLSPITRPKANNRNVLQPYSDSMKDLLKKKTYNSGRRPSEHSIGSRSFLRDNGGSIPGNVITIANTSSSDPYQKFCKEKGIRPHPARMPVALAEFFIKFLTVPQDIVLDPFGGSNITGYAAQKNQRRWISIEKEESYALASRSRFAD